MDMNIKKWIDQNAAGGKLCFTQEELMSGMNSSEVALRSALRRLKQKGEIASPLRGFYMVVPPEYRFLGSLPPEQFIDDLMSYLELPYYIGLLSAAQCYGAPYHQTLQVLIPKPRRAMQGIEFITKADTAKCSLRQFSTPRGLIRVAAPETTAIDLIAFPEHAGGIAAVFETFSDIAGHLNVKEFAAALKQVDKAPLIQRLGLFFDRLGFAPFAKLCEEALKTYPYVRITSLDPQDHSEGGELDEKWKLRCKALYIESRDCIK